MDQEIAALNEMIAKQQEAAQKDAKTAEEKPQSKEKQAQITIEDFDKVELRVAKIVACEPVKRAKKLLKITLDDGEGERTIVSGIAKHYTPEQLIGHNIIVIANLAPATLCGVESNGMLIAGDTPDGGVKVVFADDLPVGARLH